ncbi:uncharacterized protein LOC106176491 [Lingula anatina]|uniref:Uncharacterized protein LOC106176491 n=1 Tax=Lingula anatina TaxID=7574 RepID=A0A1S3JVF9_LINAN|nr:uncharacterized protein LOC106176491 [Lingula anatina]|eukprot:XP_013414353.1 uncharacterized protein LOC106176491 [Lingula anatina]
MGGTSSSTSYERQGRRVDAAATPSYFHETVIGPCGIRGDNKALSKVDRGLSMVKVCKSDATELQRKLQREYFSHWEERCDVSEFHDFTVDQIDQLIEKIHRKMRKSGQDVRKKLRGIRWSEQWSQKMFEFSFGDDLQSGVVYFGMIALAKDGAGFIDAATCLYKLDFTVAQEKVVRTDTDHFLGIELETRTRTSYRDRSLGFVTAQALKNFARTKAVEAFQERGLLRAVNYVSSLEATE